MNQDTHASYIKITFDSLNNQPRKELMKVHNALARALAEDMCQEHVCETKLGKGHALMVFVFHPQNTVEVGVSFCSPRDEYDVLKGMVIAHGRLMKKAITLIEPETDSATSLLRHVFSQEPDIFPSWARKAMTR